MNWYPGLGKFGKPAHIKGEVDALILIMAAPRVPEWNGTNKRTKRGKLGLGPRTVARPIGNRRVAVPRPKEGAQGAAGIVASERYCKAFQFAQLGRQTSTLMGIDHARCCGDDDDQADAARSIWIKKDESRFHAAVSFTHMASR